MDMGCPITDFLHRYLDLARIENHNRYISLLFPSSVCVDFDLLVGPEGASGVLYQCCCVCWLVGTGTNGALPVVWLARGRIRISFVAVLRKILLGKSLVARHSADCLLPDHWNSVAPGNL